MKTIMLRPVDIERDFGQLAELFTNEQSEPTTEAGLREDYEAHKERIICLKAAVDETGELMGFNWGTRSRFDSNEVYFYIIVKSGHRKHGVGTRLYEDFLQAAQHEGMKKLQVSIRDNDPEIRSFAEHRGFHECRHSIAMQLDLATFDDQPYDNLIEKIKNEGYRFTTMQELGDTEEAQRKLYVLNDTAASETPGSDGQHPWLSFEDFQKGVCKANWYKPDAQFMVIENATGNWVAMSAITRFDGADYAFNLFTGVDARYRGRKLAQAVKTLALRYARDVLKVSTARTDHNELNQPMIAIDRKFGYVQVPGMYRMEKMLDE
jgi:GNAT superfamily N-acetyltransferase